MRTYIQLNVFSINSPVGLKSLNEALKDGWALHGSPVAAGAGGQYGNVLAVYQAVFKSFKEGENNAEM